VTVSSGYRSPELCIAIGSKTTSQHAKGEAADFEIFGVSNKVLADWIHNNINYDQLILEFWSPEDPIRQRKEIIRNQEARAVKKELFSNEISYYGFWSYAFFSFTDSFKKKNGICNQRVFIKTIL
jgi:hypothetical protein